MPIAPPTQSHTVKTWNTDLGHHQRGNDEVVAAQPKAGMPMATARTASATVIASGRPSHGLMSNFTERTAEV